MTAHDKPAEDKDDALDLDALAADVYAVRYLVGALEGETTHAAVRRVLLAAAGLQRQQAAEVLHLQQTVRLASEKLEAYARATERHEEIGLAAEALDVLYSADGRETGKP